MEEVTTYHKIPGPFKRHTTGEYKNKLIAWQWSTPELEFLADVEWTFTEKIDGTNIRVLWDGYNVEFRGRTDRADIPKPLLAALEEMFPEELLEQTFGVNSAVLYGEGYGAGIQKGGGNYRSDVSFILFDIFIGGYYLMRDKVDEIAQSLGIKSVPVRMIGTLKEAVKAMAQYPLYTYVAEVRPRGKEIAIPLAEGVVGTPSVPLFARNGDRIIVKLKGCDLLGLELD